PARTPRRPWRRRTRCAPTPTRPAETSRSSSPSPDLSLTCCCARARYPPSVGAISAVDGFQRRHAVIGFPIAVVYKYFDDQGPYLAAALTYYAFIAIFPL